MASRPGHSQDGYVPSSSPSSDPHDPFHHPVQMPEAHRYYDNDSDHLDRYDRQRDTYASDGSQADDDRYFEQGGPYDYSASLFLPNPAPLTVPTDPRHRLGCGRLRPEIRALDRVAGAAAHGHLRVVDAHVRRQQRHARRPRTVPGMELRASDPAVQGGDRGHFPRPHAEVWFPTRLDEKHGALSLSRAQNMLPRSPLCPSLPTSLVFSGERTWPSNPKPCVLHARGEARRLCTGTVRPLSARSKHVAEFLASVLAFILSGC